MDHRKRQTAEEQLALWEWVLAAQERRHEVIDLVWGAADGEQAAERLRELLGIEGGDPLVVLDMRMWHLTKEARDQLAANVSHVRDLLGRA
jgi:hypothetical protein